MTDLRKAAEEAAKVLANALSIDFNDKRDWYSYKHDVEYAANILRQALAQPEQEHIECGYDETVGMCTNNPCCEQAQPEQEPVAKHVCNLWINPETSFYEVDRCTHPINEVFPVYTAPPKREWVGLTDMDIHVLKMNHDKVKVVHTDRAEDLTVLGQDVDVNGLINAIQTKLKELNT